MFGNGGRRAAGWLLTGACGLWGCSDAAPGADSEGPVDSRVAPTTDGAAEDAVVADAAVDALAPDLALLDAAEPDADPLDLGPPVDALDRPPVPVAIDTILGSPTTTAGLANRVTCVALDVKGETVEGVTMRFEIRPDRGWIAVEGEPDQVIGQRSDTYSVTCTAPALGLRDGTPARWDVFPGPPARLVTSLDRSAITAGETVTATCTAEDAVGNPVDVSAATVEVLPAGVRALVAGRDLTVETAGRLSVGCRLPGVLETVDAPLAVAPDLPARLVHNLDPDRSVHRLGSVVGLNARVFDRFDNPVPAAPLSWGLSPTLPDFGEGRWLGDAEGRYLAQVAVAPPTFENRVLEGEQPFVIDAGGPALACDAPTDGAMLDTSPRTVRVRVEDVLGVASLRINGQPATLLGEGLYGLDVNPSFGLNVQEVLAEDAAGNQSTTFCSHFAAATYHGEDAPLADAVQLVLTQRAVDDNLPAVPITSLTDLVRRVIDSDGLRATLDEALRAQNPIVPNECRVRLPIVGCIARFGAEYRSLTLAGPNSVRATLVPGGLQLVARINNITVRGRSLGTIETDFTVRARYIEVAITFDVNLAGGRPNVTVRRTDRVEIGDINLDLGGALGSLFDGIIDLIFGAFDGLVRDELAGAIEDFVQSEVDALLSDVLSNLDLASLGAELVVPALGGGEPTPLGLVLGFSALDVNAQRLRLGIGTSVTGPARQAAPSAGVPVPPGPVRIELAPVGTVGASVSVALVNQVLHRLWRAGAFELSDAGDLLGDLPDGAGIALRVRVPPAAEGLAPNAEGAPGIRLHLGPAEGELRYPALFAEPLRVRLALKARASVRLRPGAAGAGAEIAFEGIVIERLWVAFDGAETSPEAQAALERDLRRILQTVLDQSLNDALPTLPVPDFALPDALSAFGIPAGTRLGLQRPQLTSTPSHLVLDGSFGE